MVVTPAILYAAPFDVIFIIFLVPQWLTVWRRQYPGFIISAFDMGPFSGFTILLIVFTIISDPRTYKAS